ncbi:unnamed protein product [Euphydryas editha]|uniref:FLYWCH-type domain-containing protein n=1 Tax=Euphydryas editha TaxID=104508 RepID=A0AAU9TFC3_EUPED|nr:unnamed protein product [Euphydryas editha]
MFEGSILSPHLKTIICSSPNDNNDTRPSIYKISKSFLHEDAEYREQVEMYQHTPLLRIVLQVQEQFVRHFLGPAASTKEVHCPARLSISSTSSTLTRSNLSQHQLEELPRRQSKLVRKRCTGCYAKLKAQGLLITLQNGKNQLLYKGYTYYKHYTSRLHNSIRWTCTRYPKCKAYVYTSESLVIKSVNNEHCHVARQLHINNDGKYIKL